MAKVRWAVRCTASCTTGGPCGQWAITGGYVCWHHGGASPAVRAAAARRWEFELMMRRIERRSPLAAAFMRAEFPADPATYRKHGNADERASWTPRFIPVNLAAMAEERRAAG